MYPNLNLNTNSKQITTKTVPKYCATFGEKF